MEEFEENTEEEFLEGGLRYKLADFEGPLDLLLEIVKKNKLDIETLRLADITEQYLSYMDQCETLDMERASEFITIAATLIEIKARSILPRQEEILDEDDPEKQLLEKMKLYKEYTLFKEAGEKLHNIEDVNRMYKQPDNSVGNAKIVLKDMVLDKLLDAFVGLLTKVDKKDLVEEPKTIVKDRFTVAEKILSIRRILMEKQEVKFEDLFLAGQTKSELINIFLAVLELLKMQIAKLEQEELFGDIVIRANPDKQEGKNEEFKGNN